MSAENAAADSTNARLHRVASLAKRLLATAPLYDAGLAPDHRPATPAECEDTALATALLCHATGGDIAEFATLHQLDPGTLQATWPRLVAGAWRRLVASGPGAEQDWHRGMALQLKYIADICPRER